MTIIIVLAAITAIVCVSQLISFTRLYRYVERELARPRSNYCPKATVILPCKGLDPDFEGNVRKLMDQDYDDFEVIFAVSSTSDPAYPILKQISDSSTRVPAKVVVAGVHPKRAQKINNQLTALEEVNPETEVLAFVDSDVIARNDFLRQLIAPLSDTSIGATTGYRFYISSLKNCPAMLRALWNRVSAWEMASPRTAFAWGGAMAIRRQTFEQARVRQHWDCAADDDLSLTTAVKALGLRVHFVPQCLVSSDGNSSLAEIIEWTNRQLILTKVYYPQLWLKGIARAGIMAAWLIAVTYAVAAWSLTGEQEYATATLVGLSTIMIEIFFLIKARGLWEKVLSEHKGYLRESLITSIMAIPLAHVVLPWMTLYSVLTNRIQWRGVTYELKSPTETLVIS